MEFRTENLPASDRFAGWCQMAAQSLISTHIRSPEVDFLATVRVVELGPVQVCTLSVPEMEVIRSPKLIRQSDPELYQVAMFEHGDYWFARAGHEARLNPGSLMICDSSRPFRAQVKPVGAATCAITVAQFPRAMCPPGLDEVGRLVGHRLCGQTGIGAVLAGHLNGLVRHASDLGGADSARLATVTLDLLAAWCAHELGAADSLPPQTRHRVLVTRIHDHIGRHLADPGLSPATIARAHHISVRHLHNLFHMQGQTVAGWIRHRRLERCRRDLSDPQLSDRPIHAVAARWGFTDNAHFSRVFRKAYNMSPTECRASANENPKNSGHRFHGGDLATMGMATAAPDGDYTTGDTVADP